MPERAKFHYRQLDRKNQNGDKWEMIENPQKLPGEIFFSKLQKNIQN